MSTDDIQAELGLSAKNYERMIVGASSKGGRLPPDHPDSLESRRKRKAEERAQASVHAHSAHAAMEGMDEEERARQMGLAMSFEEPYWKHESKGVIRFVDRPSRCPTFVPREAESTLHALDDGKMVQINADISKKTKGARGRRKNEHWGAALEFHDVQYKTTDGRKYVEHYRSLPKTESTSSRWKADLARFESQWRGKGRSPLVPENWPLHERLRIVAPRGTDIDGHRRAIMNGTGK